MSAEAGAWAVRQRVRATEEKLVLLLLANKAGPDGFVAHACLHELIAAARMDGCDLLTHMRRLIDAKVIAYGVLDACAGYWLQLGHDFDLRSFAQRQAAVDP